MKKKYLIWLCIILSVFILASCTKHVDSNQYQSLWDDKEYFTFDNGKYTFVSEEGQESGTYVQKKDILQLTDVKKKTTKYQVYKKYLLVKSYTGNIPATNIFSATCTDNSTSWKFNDDGTMSRTKTVLDKKSTASGTYLRVGDIITVKLDNGEKHQLLVKNNVLYQAYEKQ